MKANYIKNVIQSYDKSPYECILIDGPWGVGKSYAVKEILDNNNNACHISMFGIKDAQEIYHEVFFQLAIKDKQKIRVLISKAKKFGAAISDKIATAERIIECCILYYLQKYRFSNNLQHPVQNFLPSSSSYCRISLSSTCK